MSPQGYIWAPRSKPSMRCTPHADMTSDTLDRTAIGVSFLCLLHCLAGPVLVVIVPGLVGGWLSIVLRNERIIHTALLLVIVPLSLWALVRGSSARTRQRLLGVAGLALLSLVAAITLPAGVPHQETVLTVVGSILLVVCHAHNLRVRLSPREPGHA